MSTRSRNLFLALLVGLALGQGCKESGDPIHTHVICQDRDEGCKEKIPAFEAWVSADALSRPASTFTIWAVGPDRQHYRPVFTACVPPSWGADVLATKAIFLKAAREGAGGSPRGDAVGAALPEGCVPPGAEAPGSHRLQVSDTVSPIGPRVWQAMASPAANSSGPLHMAVLCDRSDSTQGACNATALRGTFNLFIAESQATTGSSLSIYRVGSSSETVRSVLSFSIPERSMGEKAALLLSTRNELSGLLADTAEEDASAVAEAIQVAVNRMREQAGRYQLVVLSDMRQVTPGGVWNFEASIPSPQRFATWLEKQGLLADLRDVSVLVYGLHNRHTNAALMEQIRGAWAGAFRVMGSRDVKMFETYEAAFASQWALAKTTEV